LAVGVIAGNNAEFLAKIPADRPDYLMPLYILEYLPHGIIGLLLVAIMSAAMSTLSSAVNSLSAVSLEDMQGLGWKPKSAAGEIIWARGAALLWGLVILGLSAFAGDIADTVIEAINKVGSALYGPVLGVFLIAILRRNRSVIAINGGFFAGVALNIYLWLAQPQIFWMWWNVIGLLVTLGVAWALSALGGISAANDGDILPQAAGAASKAQIKITTMAMIFVTIAMMAIAFSMRLL
jgi:Na+/proline symporter